MESIELPNGEQIALGCNVPERRPERLMAYADSEPVLSMDQIAEILRDPNRLLGRNRFGHDWIANQGRVGSCNAYAGARALMRTRQMAGMTYQELSAEFVYSNINGGRDQGSMLDDGMDWLEREGTCLAELVPHETYLKSRIRPEAYAQAKRFRAAECYRVDTEMELASGLALGFAGVVAVHVDQSFSRIDRDGVISPTDGPGNHAVTVDDVRIHHGELQFDMPNSWGTNWGDNGRGWLSWKRHLRTTNRYHAFYLIRTATDDPNEEGI